MSKVIHLLIYLVVTVYIIHDYYLQIHNIIYSSSRYDVPFSNYSITA